MPLSASIDHGMNSLVRHAGIDVGQYQIAWTIFSRDPLEVLLDFLGIDHVTCL